MRGVSGVLAWCRSLLASYPAINIRDMSTSWRDGRAFCALVHKFRPDLINFPLLSAADPAYNCELAFTAAETFLHIPRLLDVADIVGVNCPDQLSVMTYVSLFYHKFYKSRRGLVHSLMFASNTGPEISDRENHFISELERYRADKGLIYRELREIFSQESVQSHPPPPQLNSSSERQPWQGENRTNTVTSEAQQRQRSRDTGGDTHNWSRRLRSCGHMYKNLLSRLNRIFHVENIC